MSFLLEDRGGGASGAPAVKYCDAPLPVTSFKTGAAYLCDLKFADSGPRLLTVVSPQWYSYVLHKICVRICVRIHVLGCMFVYISVFACMYAYLYNHMLGSWD